MRARTITVDGLTVYPQQLSRNLRSETVQTPPLADQRGRAEPADRPWEYAPLLSNMNGTSMKSRLHPRRRQTPAYRAVGTQATSQRPTGSAPRRRGVMRGQATDRPIPLPSARSCPEANSAPLIERHLPRTNRERSVGADVARQLVNCNMPLLASAVGLLWLGHASAIFDIADYVDQDLSKEVYELTGREMLA